MNPEDFRAPSAGRVILTPAGYSAFIPAPLPPELVYDPELVLTLSRADAALSELSGLGGQLPNPHLLISPYMRREAVLSSRIEGTKATLSDLLLDEVETDRPADADVREVHNWRASPRPLVRRPARRAGSWTCGKPTGSACARSRTPRSSSTSCS